MASAATIGALRVTLGADTAAFEAGMKQARSSLASFGKFATVGAAGVAAAAASIGIAFAAAAKKTIDAAEEMGAIAQKTGVAVEELSKLKYAADQSEVSFDSLQTGLKKLSKNMYDVASGGAGPAASAFKALGIQVQNSDGTLRSSSDVMSDVAAAFGNMHDGAAKTAIAMAVFGKSGADMIPLLNSGKDGIAALKTEAEQLGIVIDSKTAAAADNFNDNLHTMKLAGDGIVTQITAKMLPTMETFSSMLIGAAKNANLMKVAADVLNVTLKALATGAIIVGSSFKAMMQAAGAAAHVSDLVVHGQFAEALKAVGVGTHDVLETVRGAAGSINRIWSDAGATAKAKAPKVGDDLASPAVHAAGKVKAARESVEKDAHAIADALGYFASPSQKLAEEVEKNLSVIRRAFDAGKVSAEAYAQALNAALVKRMDVGKLDTQAPQLAISDEDVKRSHDAVAKIGAQITHSMEGAQEATKKAREEFRDTAWNVSGNVDQMVGALRDGDWSSAADGLIGAMDSIKAAFAEGSTAATKFAAVAGLVSAAGKAIGGTAGSTLSGAASGAMAGFQMGGPVGAAIGGTLGAIGGFLSGQKAAKEAKRKAAEEAAAKAAELANAKRKLEIAVMRQSGDTVGALAAERADELAAMDASLRPLQERIYALDDLATNTAKYGDELQTLADQRASAQADLDAARSDLSAAYEREKSAIEATKDKFQGFIDSFRAFRQQLTDVATGPARTLTSLLGRLGAATAKALTGDDKAMGELVDLGQSTTQASEASSKTLLDHLRVLAQVKASVIKAETYAGDQLSVADQQLNALNAQVSGLIDINASVLSVGDAINRLAAAQGVLDSQSQWVPGSDTWNAAAASGQAAAASGGWDISKVKDTWLANPDMFRAVYESLKANQGSLAAGDAIYNLAPGTTAAIAQMQGLPRFAAGGAFRVGGMAGIDQNVMSLNGIPVARVNRGEMVSVTPGNDNLGSRLDQLRADMNVAMVTIARSTADTARTLRKFDIDGLPEARTVA